MKYSRREDNDHIVDMNGVLFAQACNSKDAELICDALNAYQPDKVDDGVEGHITISTIEELSDVATAENMVTLLNDLALSLCVFMDLRKKHPDIKMPAFYWKDDGINEITAYKLNTTIYPFKKHSADPYCDEVMSGRLSNVLADHWTSKNLQKSIMQPYPKLSECAPLSIAKQLKNIGPKSIQEYKDIMTQYGFTDKIDC